MSEECHLLADAGTSGNLEGLKEERNSPKSTSLAGESDGKYLAWFSALKRQLKDQSKIPYKKLHQSRFKRRKGKRKEKKDPIYGQLLFLLSLRR